MIGAAPTPRLLLLVPTTSYRTRDFMAAAGRLGVEVVVGSDQDEVLSLAERGLTVDFDDVEASVARIAAYAAERPLTTIVSVDDQAAHVAAAAGIALGLPKNPPEAVQNARNKYLFRQALAAAGLPSPAFRLVPLDAAPAEIAREVAFPCVLKPLTLAMSRGVIRADGHNSFVDAFQRIAAIIARPDARTPGIAADHLLVEGYLSGTEYAVEGLLEQGRLHLLALFDKPDPLDGPYFEETIYVSPAEVTPERREAIRAAAERALAAIGLVDGPVHIDLRVDGDTVYILEADARSIGGHCGRSLRFGHGLRLEDIILRHAAGLAIESREQDGAGGVMMIPIPATGTLRALHGRDEALAVPHIADLSITIPLGERVEQLPEGHRYLGFIICHAPTPAEVVARLREAHARLRFDIDTSGRAAA